MVAEIIVVKTARWIFLVIGMVLLGWASGVAMDVATALLTGQRLDSSILAPSSDGYREAGYVGFFGLAVLFDWLARRRVGHRVPVLNGAGYNMPYMLADLTGAMRAGLIVFTLGIACVALPATYSIPDYLSLARLPWPVQAVVAYVAGTFAQYWYHRFMHTKLMWPLHAVHHSDRDFGILTVNRHHPIEVFILYMAIIAAIAPLGIDTRAIVAAMVPAMLVSTLQHSHLPFPRWAERWIVIGPAAHRVHHSTASAHYNRNFGVLAIWDRLFGTFILPANARDGTTGIDDPRYDTGRPFRELFVSARIWLDGLSAAVSPKAVHHATVETAVVPK
jgi:sterol desaturase/sphingolipid hydroxylase (fatty acid hydroxylase superfamily)